MNIMEKEQHQQFSEILVTIYLYHEEIILDVYQTYERC